MLPMVKVAVALLAVALAASASAAGWRSVRIDGSSDAGFATSVAEFEDKLPPARYHVLLQALKDVWEQGSKNAEAAQSEYTASDYLRQLDGLAYDQVVTLTDPTGDTARARLRTACVRYSSCPRSRPLHEQAQSGRDRSLETPWPRSEPPIGVPRGGWGGQSPNQANRDCGGCYFPP
jgi:hypothetical protein